MKLKRLEITHLPGIRRGLSVEGFGRGINLVTGPNASGKSSLIRALRHLLDPAPEPRGGALTLAAELIAERGTEGEAENVWTVTRTGSEIIWQRQGKPAEPPPLPATDFLTCYWLSMDDLLTEGETDAQIAARLKRLLSGGFDLDAVRKSAPFDVGPRHGQAQQRDLAAKETALQEVVRRYDHLEREREQLPELEQEIQSAAAAAARADKTRRALQWLEARREHRVIEARLAEFPPGMERLKGHEAKSLEDLEARRRTLEARRAESERALEAAQAMLAETGLDENPPDPAELALHRRELEEIRDAHTRLESLREQAIEAKSAETVAAAALAVETPAATTEAFAEARSRSPGTDAPSPGTDTRSAGIDALSPGTDTRSAGIDALSSETDTGSAGIDALSPGTSRASFISSTADRPLRGETAKVGDASRPPSISPRDVDRAVQLAERLREAERSVRELEALTGIEPVDAIAIDAHEALANELRRWLRQLDPQRFGWLFGGGVTTLALGLAAALVAAGDEALIAAGLAGAAAAGAIVLLANVVSLRNERIAAQARAAEQPLDLPAAWTAEEVARRLVEVEREHAALLVEQSRANDAAVRLRDLDPLRDELEALRREKAALAGEIGFNPAAPGESIARFLQLARDLDAARTKQHEIRLKYADLHRCTEERTKRVVEYLCRYGACSDTDVRELNALRAALEALEARAERFREARRTIDEAERALQGDADERQRIEAELDQLFDDAGVARGDREALLERCAHFDAFRAERAAEMQAVTREQERQSGVADDAELVERVEADDEAGLRALLNELELRAENLEENRNRHASLRASLDQAGLDRALERARQARDEAREALRTVYEEAMLAEAAQFLLDDVADEHRAEREPEVLAAARERFARFTHDRYALIVDDEGRFRARDNRYGSEHELATLSTGTRMQLLLAARLAWTAVAEQGRETLPIMLDEALTTSDPERFTSIARNLKDTADREGRQIFYLSADPADVVRWERATGQRPTHIEMPPAGAHPALAPADYAFAELEPLPPPNGASAAEYAAQLGVLPPDLYGGAGAAHVFYLLRDDLELLHRLMSDWRITHVGQLEAMLQSGVAAYVVPEPAARDRLAARIGIAHVWFDLWRQGRGQPVDRNVLEASGAVTDRFIDDVTELAAQLRGDAQSLIDALENRKVPGFLRAKIRELAEWLEEQGYLDTDEVLTPDERVRSTLSRAAALAPPNEIQHVIASLEAAADAQIGGEDRAAAEEELA